VIPSHLMAIHQVVLLLSLAVAAPADKGSLRIQSAPRTEVIWEGVSLDTTNASGTLTITDIPPGRFSLVLKKSGFRPEKRVIEIAAGETMTLSAPLSREAPALKSVSPTRVEQRPGPTPVNARVEAPASRKTADGRVPLWPSLPKPASTSAPSSHIGVIGLLALIPALLVVIYLVRRPRPAALAPHPLLAPESSAPEPAPRGEPKSAPFLKDLRKREELLEQGVEIIPPRPSNTRVIDLDSANVREVEE